MIFSPVAEAVNAVYAQILLCQRILPLLQKAFFHGRTVSSAVRR
jgi:hypothetical protein